MLEFDKISMKLNVGVRNTGFYFIKYNNIMKISTILMIFLKLSQKNSRGL